MVVGRRPPAVSGPAGSVLVMAVVPVYRTGHVRRASVQTARFGFSPSRSLLAGVTVGTAELPYRTIELMVLLSALSAAAITNRRSRQL